MLDEFPTFLQGALHIKISKENMSSEPLKAHEMEGGDKVLES
jgi:hypothetical protein